MSNAGQPPATPPAMHAHTPAQTFEELVFDVEDLRGQLAGVDQVRREVVEVRAAQTALAGTQARQGLLIARLLQGVEMLLTHHGLSLPPENIQATVPA